jgi:D-alanyl-D-alanine endopeptidase (penicillin-binding protein 7)
LKTFAAALLSLSLLSFVGTTEAAATTSSKAKAGATQTRKVKSVVLRKQAAVPVLRAVPTFGQVAGLHDVDDPLDLKSSVAYVLDQDTNEVLFSKNPQAVLPIASITKLMTALVVVEAGLSLDEKLTVTEEDIDTEKFTRSRLAVGTTLTRGEMLHLALMASENRAAHALGRHYPGGLEAFVAAMNAKATALGMTGTHYVEPTGLSSRNQSSAADLAKLVNVTSQVPLLRDLSTSREARVALGKRLVQFRSTNGLLSNPLWDIGLQKTGFINEAGKCLVMQASMAGRKLIMVFLDSSGKASRIADAERMRKWLAAQTGETSTVSAKL